MTGPIYDDNLLVLRACKVIEDVPSYRPLVYGLTCVLGEDLTRTRLLCLLFVLVAVFALVRLFFQRVTPFKFFAVALHPLTLFPFFYPSQLSTALTMFWASLGALFIASRDEAKGRGLFLCAVWAILGIYVRIEALVFLYLILGTYFLYQWAVCRSLRDCLHAVMLRKLFILTFAMLAYPHILEVLGREFATSPIHTLSLAGDVDGDVMYYPKDSFAAVQAWAIFLYFKSFVFPFGPSFWGGWTDWVKIHQSQALQYSLLGAYALLLGLSCWTIFLRKTTGLKLRLFFSGVACFVVITSIFSLVMRMDWYFLSRAVLASTLLSLFFVAICHESKAYWAKAGLVTYVLAALCFTYFYQYRNDAVFAAYELKENGSRSPRAQYLAAARLMNEGRLEEALLGFHSAYDSLASEIVAVSAQGQQIWNFSLYRGWQISHRLGYKDSAKSALRQIAQSNLAPAVPQFRVRFPRH